MSIAIQNMVIWVLRQVLTADVIKGAEVELIAFLKACAAKTSSPIDDALIKMLADALGVPLE